MVILTHHENYEVVKKINLPLCKVIVVGKRDKRWFGIKNLHFMSLRKFIKNYQKKFSSILILDKINYIDPECISLFKKQKQGIFAGSNLTSDSVLYLAQTMGNIPFHLTSDWHDNYIDKNLLGQSSLSEEFVEIFLSRHRKYPSEFDFNKYRTKESCSVIFTKNNIFKHISNKKISSVQELLNQIEYKYLLSGCWYLIDDNKNLINRLYKH